MQLEGPTRVRARGRPLLLDQDQPAPSRLRAVAGRPTLVTLDNPRRSYGLRAGDGSFKCLPYQLSMFGAMPNMVMTGNGESGFDSGEGA